MKTLVSPLGALVLAGAMAGSMGAALAQAQAPADAHDSHHASEPVAPATPAAQGTPGNAPADQSELSEGEITRWDARTLKVTLRHGEIKNLGMPPMTMVFRVNDASMLAPFRPGDKVRFRVEQISTGYFITRMEAAR